MRLNITARHFNASDRLKEYTEKEVRRLKRYYDGILNCDVILDYEKQAQVAEIVLHVYGSKLTVREKSEDMYKSINLAVDKLERQLKKYKGKLREFEAVKARDVLAE
ncbi:MAG: ribosome-associated translation inhibitor RaiA [candidate division KSB1 bacterium]|nr:ribosome-associated translation inhibitor RaiA [candidate division KSB1 bacterium]MDZ7295894.1 ribosome-associated translation inhibitor RaiA [candidate division KSB1 bacterium]MDZ7385759.1 ribosome-associated translation inhibitor RaiA [candidate division KSB1 bacterium]MDZ7391350.1 ribosome-associated translation inhibitor RaiA [candidate division KSB1 bacterium]MDZ7414507.1 ribosome-associated translation inhibitor RaiA [candidate division KSB1 bacterium]